MENGGDPQNDKALKKLSFGRLAIGLLLTLLGILIFAAPKGGMPTPLGFFFALESEQAVFWSVPLFAAGLSLLLTSFETFDATITGPVPLLGKELGAFVQGFSVLFLSIAIGLFVLFFWVVDPLGKAKQALLERGDLNDRLDSVISHLNGLKVSMRVRFRCPGEIEYRKLYSSIDQNQQVYLSLEPNPDAATAGNGKQNVEAWAQFTINGFNTARMVKFFPDSGYRTQALELSFIHEEHEDDDTGITAMISIQNLDALSQKCKTLGQDGMPESLIANAVPGDQAPAIPPSRQ